MKITYIYWDVGMGAARSNYNILMKQGIITELSLSIAT